MAASEIRIKVPHPDSGLINNLLGVLGLVAIVCAVGGLAGWLWALGLAGVFAVAMSLIGSTYARDEDAADDGAGGAGEAGSAMAAVTAVPRSA